MPDYQYCFRWAVYDAVTKQLQICNFSTTKEDILKSLEQGRHTLVVLRYHEVKVDWDQVAQLKQEEPAQLELSVPQVEEAIPQPA